MIKMDSLPSSKVLWRVVYSKQTASLNIYYSQSINLMAEIFHSLIDCARLNNTVMYTGLHTYIVHIAFMSKLLAPRHQQLCTRALTLFDELNRFLTSDLVFFSPSLCLLSVERRVFILLRTTASCLRGNTQVPSMSPPSSTPFPSDDEETAVTQ